MLETLYTPGLSDGDLWEIAQTCSVLNDATLSALIRLVNMLRSHTVTDIAQTNPDLAPLQTTLELVKGMAVASLRQHLDEIGAIEGETVNFEALQSHCQRQLRSEITRRRIS